MKFLKSLLIIVVLMCLSGCLSCKIDYGKPWDPTDIVNGIPVIGPVTEIESCVLKHVQQAIVNVKRRYPQWAYINTQTTKPFMFIRSVNDKVPEMCEECFYGLYKKECGDTWGELPGVINIQESRPGNGFGGISLPHIMINRTPERNNFNDLMGLVAHEWGCHEAAVSYTHGELCTEITRLVQKEATGLMRSDPECSEFVQ